MKIDSINSVLKKQLRRTTITIISIIVIIIIFNALWPRTEEKPQEEEVAILYSTGIPEAIHRDLTPREIKWAFVAWQYFEHNTNSSTGLVDSYEGSGITTMWDCGSYLFAMISAKNLGIINEREFQLRLILLLKSLEKLEKVDSKFLNLYYNTESLEMVDADNKPAEGGIGWSAIEIARLTAALVTTMWNNPEFSNDILELLNSWNLNSIVHHGQLYSGRTDSARNIMLFHEGRLGYEQYAAKAFMLLNYIAYDALEYESSLSMVNVLGIDLPYDKRKSGFKSKYDYVESGSYILNGIEFGWDRYSREFAWRVYKTQERRYEKTGKLTATANTYIDTLPGFILNTIYNDGKTWWSFTEDGRPAPQFKAIVTDAAFGWHSLFETEYSKKVLDKLSLAFDVKKGWYSGLYQDNLKQIEITSCNTNAIVLEALAFKRFGRLININNSDLNK